jgi:hypothetical protein
MKKIGKDKIFDLFQKQGFLDKITDELPKDTIRELVKPIYHGLKVLSQVTLFLRAGKDETHRGADG